MQPLMKLMEKNMSKLVKPTVTKTQVAVPESKVEKDPYEGLDSATKARKIAAEKARIQSTQTQSKLNIQD